MNAQAWKELVSAVPCVVCTKAGIEQAERTTLHHPRKDKGIAQRASDWLVTALCWEHHMGRTGIEGLGIRAFEQRYKLTEMDLLAMTIEGVAKQL